MQDPTRASITRDHETVQYDDEEVSPTKSRKKLKKGKNREEEA